MCLYNDADKQLYKEYKRLEKLWKDRSAEIIAEMVTDGVDKVYSEDGMSYMKLVVMPETQIPNYTRKSYSYIRFNWYNTFYLSPINQ